MVKVSENQSRESATAASNQLCFVVLKDSLVESTVLFSIDTARRYCSLTLLSSLGV